MILITGSGGFIGRSFIRLLGESGHAFKEYTGRINDPLNLRAELLDVETVVHLAGAETRDRVRLLHHVDVDGTERLLEECRRANITRLILISRLNADPNSLYALLRAKGEAERLVRQSGIPYVIIRSATLFGREDRFLNAIAGLAAWSWPFVWIPGGGQVAMQPLWVEDLARCLLATLERSDLTGKTIEIAGEERFHYAEIVRQVLITTGMRRRPIYPPVKLVRPISLMVFGWLRRAPVTRYYLDRLSTPEVAPLDASLRYFGFKPARMARHMAYLRRTGLRWHLFNL